MLVIRIILLIACSRLDKHEGVCKRKLETAAKRGFPTRGVFKGHKHSFVDSNQKRLATQTKPRSPFEAALADTTITSLGGLFERIGCGDTNVAMVQLIKAFASLCTNNPHRCETNADAYLRPRSQLLLIFFVHAIHTTKAACWSAHHPLPRGRMVRPSHLLVCSASRARLSPASKRSKF